jgi:hypothetical protein
VCLCSFLIFSFVVHKFGFREWTASNVEGFSSFAKQCKSKATAVFVETLEYLPTFGAACARQQILNSKCQNTALYFYLTIYPFAFLSLLTYLYLFSFFLCSCAIHSSLFLQQSLSILVPFVPFKIPLLPLLFPSFRPIFQLLLPEVLRTPVLPFSNSNHDGLNSFVYAVTRCKSIIRFRLFKMSVYCVRQTGNNDSMCVFELISNYQYETTANYIKM